MGASEKASPCCDARWSGASTLVVDPYPPAVWRWYFHSPGMGAFWKFPLAVFIMSIPSCWSSELDLPLTTTRLSVSRPLSCLICQDFDNLNISIRRCACPNLSCTPIMRASSSAFFSSHTLVDAYAQRWPQYNILDGSWTSWRFSSKKHVFLALSLLWLPQLSSPHKFFHHNTQQASFSHSILPFCLWSFLFSPCLFECQLRTWHLHTWGWGYERVVGWAEVNKSHLRSLNTLGTSFVHWSTLCSVSFHISMLPFFSG